MATPIRIKRSAVPGKRPQVTDLQVGELALNTHDAELVTLRDRFAQTGIATEVVRVGAGATVTNVLYVTKDGSDNNTGKKLGDAKATLKAAVGIAGTGDVIRVSAGTYVENNPIILPEQVSIVGDSLREVTITPQNAGSDLFHVAPGVYISDVSFVGTMNSGSAVVAFNPDIVYYYTQSPYIHNCTNFITNSIGMKIDGSKNIGPFKSMVTDSYTQYNSNGIGVSLSNEGYAQIVSMFTINTDVAIAANSGGQCDITNSNSSFGNFGLVTDGVGPRKYTGIVTTSQVENRDNFVVNLSTPTINISNFVYDIQSGLSTVTTATPHGFQVGMGVTLAGIGLTCAYGTKTYPDGKVGYIFEVKSVPNSTTFTTNVGPSTVPSTYTSGGTAKLDIVRPFDGQNVFFDTLYQEVSKIKLTSGGSGYTSPPTITIQAPGTAWGIQATAVASIKNGSVDEITLVSSGRGYTSTPTITITGSATASVEMIPKYYSILKSTPISSGITTITVDDNVPYAVGAGVTVPFYKQSRILASSHSFEYIGTGVDPLNSLPQRGAVPIQDNEVEDRNGGLTIFTSTDQTGQFRIGDGVIIDQQTGTISGNFYSKSLFSTMTPFILALGGD
jgi:hypothetical protein|tara:strand:+ start:129 stop:1973 length:1845 start_codon:yes stop_codon:yes gene_type:complete